jgi:hypothetical protein
MTGIPGPDVDSSDSCPTDSSLDASNEDTHKLTQIAQALHNEQPVTICLKGSFRGYQNQSSTVRFERDHVGKAPADIFEPFHQAVAEIQTLAEVDGTSGIPGSLIWTVAQLSRDRFDISLSKLGKGITITYCLRGATGAPITQFPAAYSVEVAGKWFVAFGAEAAASDAGLIHYLVNITAPWDTSSNSYHEPWHVYVSAQPFHSGQTGEICLTALPSYPPDKDPSSPNPHIPWNSAPPRTFIEASRPKEIHRLLNFGRDSEWPLRIAVASTLDGTNSASVSYEASWEG